MTGMKVSFQDDDIEVETTDIASAFGISPDEVMKRIREGAISSVCEKGVDEDEGRYRITFFTDTCRLQLIAERGGFVLQRSKIDFGAQPLPPALHRPGT